MEPVRVCCYCEKWESGGIESFLHNVVLNMERKHIEIDIVAAELCDSVFSQELEEIGVHFYELSGSQKRLRKNYRLFKQLCKERQYAVIHLNAFQGLSLYYLHLAKQMGIPVRIAHSHNADLRKSLLRSLKIQLHKWGKKRYAKDATDLWACSEPAAKFLFDPLPLKRDFRFIPNGIDTSRFRFKPKVRTSVRTKLDLDEKFVIGNVGRLCYQKNQDFLLDIFVEILTREPDSRLLLVGDGEQRTALEEKAQRLGIIEKVIFYGVSDHVEQLLWAMDILVMPSRFEGLPVTSIEAQSAGLPCLFSSKITQECKLTKEAMFLPLSAGAAVWAECVIQLRELKNDRQCSADDVRTAGFDILDVAKQIEHEYVRNF